MGAPFRFFKVRVRRNSHRSNDIAKKHLTNVVKIGKLMSNCGFDAIPIGVETDNYDAEEKQC